MMREVIRRRYTRVLKENLRLPDLIVVDGGKGQMSAAIDVLENELGLDIPLCGLAKDDRHRTSELLYGNPPDRKSTRLNSSHVAISYAVFCLKKKNNKQKGIRL